MSAFLGNNTYSQDVINKPNLRWTGLGLLPIGLAIIAIALASPWFRDPEGYLTGAVCLPLAVGAALLVLGISIRAGYGRAGWWFFTLCIGQSASLQFIDAGNRIHYQHYHSLRILWESGRGYLIAILLLYSAIIALGLVRMIHARGIIAPEWLRRKRGLLVLVALMSFNAVPSPVLDHYLYELIIATGLQVLAVVNLILLVRALPAKPLPSWLHGFVSEMDGSRSDQQSTFLREWKIPILASLWMVASAGFLSYTIYQNHPHLQDEVLYLYQARLFSRGLLSAPAPAVPEAFSFYLIPHLSETWYSVFPPGWPAVLALGVRAGAPWLVNPILNGINSLLAYSLAKKLYNPRIGRIVLLLWVASPWIIFMGMNFMSHTLSLGLALGAILAFLFGKDRDSPLTILLAGLLVGGLSLVRPIEGAVIAGILGIWALWSRNWRLRLRQAFMLGLGILLLGSLHLPYNFALTGDPTLMPLTDYYNTYFGSNANAIGFLPDCGLGWAIDAFPGHSPLEACLNGLLNITSIQTELLGWPVGSLLMIGLLLMLGSLRPSDKKVIFVIAMVGIVHSFYWFSGGPDFGARYWYLMVFPLLALTSRGILAISDRLKRMGWRGGPLHVPFWLAILVMMALTLINYLPWRALDKYFHYLEMRPDLREMAQNGDYSNALVLIRGRPHPDYQSAWIFNPLDFQKSGPVFAQYHPDWVHELIETYPERRVRLLDGPSITGRGYEAAQWPLTDSSSMDSER